jgi:hypothetical protein
MKPKKKIIELERKLRIIKPKTNLMIAEYKKQLQKIKTIILKYYVFRQINYIEIEK